MSDSSIGRKRRLLVAEDDNSVREAIRRSFEDEFEVLEARDGDEALATARAHRPDAVLADQRMPGKRGVNLLTDLRAELPNAVRILMTGYTDYGPLHDAMENGVHHYVEKPFRTADLKAVVRALLRARDLETERDNLHGRIEELASELESFKGGGGLISGEQLERTIEDLRSANRQLQELAVRDSLTGLFNRRALDEQLELEVSRSRRYGREFSLLFMDIDDFKNINDQHGHSVGDQVLNRLAGVLSPRSDRGLRSSDFAARYGGEEFCIILPETPPAGGMIKAERLRQVIEGVPWTELHRPLDPITISIGVAGFPGMAKDARGILDAADGALYEAKRRGKNRVILAS